MADAITVHCPSCETAFPVDPDKVPEGGVNARCSECADIFRVEGPARDVEMDMQAFDDVGLPGLDVAEPGPDADTGEAWTEAPEERAWQDEGAEADEETFATEEDDWGSDYFSAPTSTERAEGGITEEEGAPEEEAAEDVTAAGLPELEETPELEVEPEEADEQEPDQDALQEMEEPGIAGPEVDIGEVETQPFMGTGADAAAGEVAEEEDLETRLGEEEESAGEAWRSETAEVVEEEVVEEEAETQPPRPTFGNRSPEEKAQRLARVLVSDMITYNPNLYETALARGTLKEDFSEEIEKSWEEYVEQVGEELATSTSHWTDALNDILAKGEETF